jgi:hypothetical protein
MTEDPDQSPGMIGEPPSSRQVPLDAGLHAADFAHRWRDRLDQYCTLRMDELGTGSHEAAVEFAPETDLPIGGRPRALLRAIRLGEQSIRGGGANPNR